MNQHRDIYFAIKNRIKDWWGENALPFLLSSLSGLAVLGGMLLRLPAPLSGTGFWDYLSFDYFNSLTPAFQIGFGVTIIAVLGIWYANYRVYINNRQNKVDRQTLGELQQFKDKAIKIRRTVFDNEMLYISTHLNFSNDERVTLFKFDGKAFYAIGRYSHSPKFNVAGKAVYPPDKGVLGKAWQENEHYWPDLPEGEKAWIDKMFDEWHYRRSESRNMAMKSRCYYGKTIDDVDTCRQFAIIMFESMKPRGIDPEAVITFLKETETERLSRLLNAFSSIEAEIQISHNAEL